MSRNRTESEEDLTYRERVKKEYKEARQLAKWNRVFEGDYHAAAIGLNLVFIVLIGVFM